MSPLPEIDIEDARRRREGGARVLDVRNPDEWAAGHVEGATWIPLPELAARYEEIPRDGEVLVICRSGGRSAKAVEALSRLGYDAMNVASGTQGWAEAGNAIVKDDGTPGTVA